MEDGTPIQKIRELQSEDQFPITLRGKEFGLYELRVIHQCISRHYQRGRTQISKEICERLEWKQPNGWLKDRACRDVLLRLEERGLIELPPRLHTPNNSRSDTRAGDQKEILNEYDFETPIDCMPANIELVFAKGDESEKTWNALVDEFHYLRHSVVVGRCIKYLVTADERLIGAVSFSSPAWQLTARDELLGSFGLGDEEIRQRVLNNSRFLILPNVKVENLASKTLAMATEKVVDDWIDYYSIEPYVAETFVQPSRYEGTCYKAANWIEIGTTSGYAKKGRAHRNSQEPKQIFLYGLSRTFRRKLAEMTSA